MAAEAAISSTVELLGDQLIHKVKFLRGVRGQVQLLKEELKRMQSFLKDANKKQAEDESVRSWISEIRDVAHDAEDTIEMFLVNVEHARNRGLLKRCISFAKRMRHLDRIGGEIESIRARLAAVDESRERCGIRSLEEAADSTQFSLRQKDEYLVGVDEDVRKLLRESVLDEEKRGLSVVVIDGAGGIGKSTLAREIYKHRDVGDGRFECRGWVVVSSGCTREETMKRLILELPGSDKQKLREVVETAEDEAYIQRKLREMLHQQLRGKNYLIVLDDVWEKEHWEYLKTAFPNEKDKTSRLLVTTRNKLIAKHSEYEHEMKGLDPEKSWELLLNKANIGSSNGKCPEELETIGREIVGKCCGLPLAISVAGGLLVETQTKSGWERVLNQINSYLARAERGVSTILELSYQNLSPQLKSCFLFLAFFKEYYSIPVKRLVDIWIAQGLIRHEGNRTTDEIARGCLNELINRSMVQIDQDFIHDGRVENCRLHDLLSALCLRKAEEEIGLEIIKGDDGFSLAKSSYKHRHRVVHGRVNHETSSLDQNKHLRSLFLLNAGVNDNICVNTPSLYWKSFQLLKMLDLDGFRLQSLPDCFRSLIGLKYLRIHRQSYSSSSHVLKLPSWLDRLKKLEVLIVENDTVVFPNVALKMERLRQFHARGVEGRAMSIENWENIETLKLIRLKDWMECSSSLTANCHLRELHMLMEGDHELSRAKALLEKMTNLVELRLEFHVSLSQMEKIIPCLDSLTTLEVSGWMLECPDASVFPRNLSRLTLSNLNDDPMQELGKLPKLRYLVLSNSKENYVDWRMKVLHDGFPCLEALSLQRMDDLRGIDIEEGGMPRLKRLQIHDCPHLETRNLPKHIIVSAA
ncbi:disease susceptibility protein LOV1-like [Salvia miltiorrhiza]|uniref:disease susceptibility protein LOV1-like n=1 Tax=Salvia miltiorrhiza TaxID=226208 RepID=UPI0025AD84BB|nr:disease susceptibility protein LOV1-like [Salvia miltiorrhiza]